MVTQEGCQFCELAALIRGDAAPTAPLYKNRAAFVIQDASPKAADHLLVIPWLHVESLDKASADTLLQVFSMVQKVGRDLGGEYRVVVNVGAGGKQEIPHLHVHVLAGPEVLEPGFARSVH